MIPPIAGPLLGQTLDELERGGRLVRVRRAVLSRDDTAALARGRGERGDEGWALHLTAEVAVRREPPNLDRVATAYREALTIAVGLEMRPLEARCHLGLGSVLRRDGRS